MRGRVDGFGSPRTSQRSLGGCIYKRAEMREGDQGLFMIADPIFFISPSSPSAEKGAVPCLTI